MMAIHHKVSARHKIRRYNNASNADEFASVITKEKAFKII
jgi:hypothetical protein